MNRRSFCALAGAGLTLLSGCLFNRGPDSGSLIINNDHDSPHTVEVIIQKVAEETTSTGSPTPTARQVLWERTYTYDVGQTTDKTVPNLLTEPGTFDIYARLDTGAEASTRLSLYRGGEDGTKVGGGIIYIDIYEDGRVVAFTPQS